MKVLINGSWRDLPISQCILFNECIVTDWKATDKETDR